MRVKEITSSQTAAKKPYAIRSAQDCADLRDGQQKLEIAVYILAITQVLMMVYLGYVLNGGAPIVF